MERDEVMDLVREHLAEELEVDRGRIAEATRFREDLEADSLDLYELVMELEDRYGIKVTEEEAPRLSPVGAAVAFVLERAPALWTAGRRPIPPPGRARPTPPSVRQ